MHTEPAADAATVTLLRDAARGALALGDATGAAALLSRALREPPAHGDRAAVLLELGQAYARAGAPEAIEPLSEVVERWSRTQAAIAEAAIELSGMLFFSGRAAEGAAVLRRAQARLPAADASPRAGRGRAAGPQLHLGVGTARGRSRDRRLARSRWSGP